MNTEPYGRTWCNGWMGNATHAYGKAATLGGDGATDGNVRVRGGSDGRLWGLAARPSVI